MANINLLPWRAERRRQRERDFYLMLAAAAVSAVLAWLVWGWWMNQRIDDQEGRNGYLRTEIQQLEGKLKEIKDLETTKAKLLARKQIIEQLQASRSQMVHLFDEMVKRIPDGARLNTFKQTGDTLTLEGYAQSNASVASYMRNLDGSDWLMHSDLQKTEAAKAGEKRDRFAFGLNVKLTDPDSKAKAKAEAEAKANGVAQPPKDAGKPAGRTSPATPPPAPKPEKVLPAVATPGSPS